MWKDFHKTHTIEIRLDIGPESVLFAGECMCALYRPEIVQGAATKQLMAISLQQITGIISGV